MSARLEPIEEMTRTVRLPAGVDLHARPAGVLVRAAAQHDAAITLAAAGRTADAKSILQVLALGATGGAEIMVTTAGAGASDALDAIADLLERLA
jgi:phosphotransferase system HPr (HPr) family protein